jgi:hypothetical protein
MACSLEIQTINYEKQTVTVSLSLEKHTEHIILTFDEIHDCCTTFEGKTINKLNMNLYLSISNLRHVIFNLIFNAGKGKLINPI